MLEPVQTKIVAFVRGSIQHWNEKNIDAMAARFRDDAVLSSPFAQENSASTWIQGKDEIIAHLKLVRARYERFKVVDVATDTSFYTILLSDGREYLTIIIEPEQPSALIRRMIICKSVFHAISS
ncbi:MAG: hypothetical protein QOJ52_4293 [Acidimicrobiaceae bacterium]|jgi:hypothetical protein|nr:hypothetical protein [Acidimicrobiaceae bacterium]